MNQDEKLPLSYWRSLGPIGLGITVGLLGVLQLWTHYHASQGFQRLNVGPDSALLFAPMFAAFLFLFALTLEVPLRWLVSAPQNHANAIAIGLSYAAVLSWWAFPDPQGVALLLNPISLRFLARTDKSKRSQR